MFGGHRDLVDPNNPEPTFTPWVTYALAAANVVVFAISIAAGSNPATGDVQVVFDLGGNFGPVTLDGEQWRLVTSMFLHYGALHLGMNLIGLIDGGRHVEKMYGHAGFAGMYLFAGLAGSLASATKGGAISAGASGAIFGVFGAFGAYLILHKERFTKSELSTKSRGLLTFLVLNVVVGFQSKMIDMTAHMGGLAGGFVAGLLLEAGKSAGKQRVLRAMLVGVIGSAAVFGAAFALKAPVAEALPPSSLAALERFATHEQQAIKALNAIAEGTPFAEAVVILDRDVIPPWRAAEAELAGAKGAGPRMREYWQTRMAALTELRAAYVKEDNVAAEAALKKFVAAVEKVNAGQ